jgi:hypothetical protein
VIDPRAAAILQNIIQRESRSLLQYVAEAFPWTDPDTAIHVSQIQEMAVKEAAHVAALGRRLVQDRYSPPFPQPYAQEFTSYNYLSLDVLLVKLAAWEKRAIDQMEQDTDRIEDSDVREELTAFLALKRVHHEKLLGLLPHLQSAAS